MIVAELDIVGVAIDESETDPPQIIDCDGVLSFSVAFESMGPAARRNFKIT